MMRLTAEDLSNINKIVESKVNKIVDEVKKSMLLLFEEKLSEIKEIFKTELQARDEDIALLKSQVEHLKNKHSQQEERLSDFEQERLNNELIISHVGLPSSPGTDATRITQALRSVLHVQLQESDITEVRRMGKPPTSGSDVRPFIFKIKDRSAKNRIMRACKQVKPSFSINESLTPYRRKLFKVLRDIRKENRSKLPVLFTKNGVIHAATSMDTGLKFIRTQTDLDNLISVMV